MTTFLQRTASALLLAASMLLLASTAQAQYRVSSKYWTIGGSVGVAGYAGDLTNPDSPGIPLTQIETLKNPGFAITANVGYHFAPRWTARGSVGYILLRGSDEKSTNAANKVRNLSFENGLLEGSAVLQFDILPERRNYRLRRMFTPYVFAGLAVALSDPRARIDVYANSTVTNSGTFPVAGVTGPVTFPGVASGSYGWQHLRDLKTEGQTTPYSSLVFAVPFGAGVKYRATERMDIGLELNFRWTFTDFLDDVSGKRVAVAGDNRPEEYYALPSQLGNDPIRIAASNRQLGIGLPAGYAERRGSAKYKDWYGSLGFTVSYILESSPGGLKCPKPKRGKKGFLGIF